MKTTQKLIKQLEKIARVMNSDPEAAHWRADRALLEYIDDKEVETAYSQIEKWYA